MNIVKLIKADVGSEKLDTAIEFFIVFSRFEYTLKASTYVKSSRIGSLEANWDKFIKSIKLKFNAQKNIDLSSSVSFILTNPPQVQKFDNNNLIWEDRIFNNSSSDIQKLNLHIRDIRNNLFHGGKYTTILNSARDYRLMQSALVILDEWISLDSNLQKIYSTL